MTREIRRVIRLAMRIHVMMLLFLGIAACSSSAGSDPQISAAGQVPEVEGARLFKAKGCYACHTVGQGVKVGPDLQGLFSRRDEAWVRRYISDPVTMVAQDPVAQHLKDTYKVQMPKMMISPGELEQLIAYLRDGTGNPEQNQTR